MNQTFENFILAPDIVRQVAQLEGVAGPSTWDRVRVPFALAATSAGAFLFPTQRDMFNQTVIVVTALAAAVPTVFALWPSSRSEMARLAASQKRNLAKALGHGE